MRRWRLKDLCFTLLEGAVHASAYVPVTVVEPPEAPVVKGLAGDPLTKL